MHGVRALEVLIGQVVLSPKRKRNYNRRATKTHMSIDSQYELRNCTQEEQVQHDE